MLFICSDWRGESDEQALSCLCLGFSCQVDSWQMTCMVTKGKFYIEICQTHTAAECLLWNDSWKIMLLWRPPDQIYLLFIRFLTWFGTVYFLDIRIYCTRNVNKQLCDKLASVAAQDAISADLSLVDKLIRPYNQEHEKLELMQYQQICPWLTNQSTPQSQTWETRAVA